MRTQKQIKPFALAALISLLFFVVGHAQAQATKKNLSPSASEIQASLVKYRMQVLQAIGDMKMDDTSQIGVDLTTFASSQFKVKVEPDVSASPRKLKVTVSTTEGEDVKNVEAVNGQDPISFAELAKEVRNLPYPTSTENMTAKDWRTYVKPVTDKINQVIKTCEARNKAPKRIHWFEVIPLQFECRAMISSNLKQWLDQLMVASEPDSSLRIPSDSDNDPNRTSFTRAKRDLAIELTMGALFQKIQYDVHADKTKTFARNKARCFPVSGPYVENVLASLAVPFQKMPSGPGYRYQTTVGEMIMPEPLYALGQHEKYRKGEDGDRLLIFNNMTDATGQNVSEFPLVEMNRDQLNSNGLQFSQNGSLHFQFNVRDLHSPGRQCVFYCQQPKPLSKEQVHGS